MKHVANISLMAVVVLGLMALGNTLFAWLLICLPLVYWCWPILAWATRRPITARLLLSCRPHLLALARRAVHSSEHRTYLVGENPQGNATPTAQGWAGHQKVLLLELTALFLGHTGDKVPRAAKHLLNC